MDLTQIAIGTGLLAVSGLTFVGPSELDSAVLSVLIGTALVLGAGALFRTLARDTQ